MKTNAIKKMSLVMLLMLTLIITSAATTFASAPSKAQIKYEGNGRVEVDFNKKVKYKNPKVVVKDTSGKKYTAVILDRDSDDLEFRIKNYKDGKTYKFTVKGVKTRGTSKYGKYNNKIKIPAVGTEISRDKAIGIAKNHANNKWGVTSYYDLDAEKDYYNGSAVWEVDFENGNYSYEYKIQKSNGNILHFEREWDD